MLTNVIYYSLNVYDVSKKKSIVKFFTTKESRDEAYDVAKRHNYLNYVYRAIAMVEDMEEGTYEIHCRQFKKDS